MNGLQLTDEEWGFVLQAMAYFKLAKGNQYEYNPMPWIKKFDAVHNKIRAAFPSNREF